MMFQRYVLPCLLTLLLPISGLAQPSSSAAPNAADDRPFSVELEAGPAWFGRNNVRIPNAGGDRFSMRDLTGTSAAASIRLYATWQLNPRHALRLTLAPLSANGTGRLSENVRFKEGDFSADTPTTGRYRFSTYRLGYRWHFHDGADWQWAVGATLLVRDARIGLQQDQLRARDDDLGVVPLLSLYGRYRLTERLGLVIDVEGAAAAQGRAVDAALKLEYSAPSGWYINGGYRTLEGGADNDELYTFAWIHYAVLGVGYRW